MARFLFYRLALVTFTFLSIGCSWIDKQTREAECINACDACSQSATASRSDPSKRIQCIACVDACQEL